MLDNNIQKIIQTSKLQKNFDNFKKINEKDQDKDSLHTYHQQ